MPVCDWTSSSNEELPQLLVLIERIVTAIQAIIDPSESMKSFAA